MVLKTVLHNKTGEEIKLKESQGGVLRTMEPSLERGGKKKVHTYESATYKEYWCAVQPNDETVVLTSDDCIEWKELEILGNPDGSFVWKGTVSRKSANQAQHKTDTDAAVAPQPKTGPGAPQPKTDTSGAVASCQTASPSGDQAAANASPVRPKPESSGVFSSLKQWLRGKKSSNDSKASGTSAASPLKEPTIKTGTPAVPSPKEAMISPNGQDLNPPEASQVT